MVTDAQVRRLMKHLQQQESLGLAAAKAGLDEKTARRYRQAQQLPSQLAVKHDWRTRPDAFTQVWSQLQEVLHLNPGLQAKTLFDDLQRRFPGQFSDGQLRTLQRRIKTWRALEGPGREVFFPQEHHPGALCQSDYTQMSSLGVTLQGRLFEHLVFHLVLTYSNWETASICFSESFESLSEGLQSALWELGGVPQIHQTDCLSAAVHPPDHPQTFTVAYAALLRHYQLEGRRCQPRCPHENGDVEQRHYRFRQAVDQALMLRGHRDFDSRAAYQHFLRQILDQLNAARLPQLAREQALLRPLPAYRFDAVHRLQVRVNRFSTIRVRSNTYSVHSRLIGETIDVRLGAEHLDLYYAQQHLERLPRQSGKGGHHIQYRHLIDWLVRKPGAFAHYRYRQELFPTTRFRLAYDALGARHLPRVADRHYLEILRLAAYHSQERVDQALETLLAQDHPWSVEQVEGLVVQTPADQRPAVYIPAVDLRLYDALLSETTTAREVA
jgi:hypothetical protein